MSQILAQAAVVLALASLGLVAYAHLKAKRNRQPKTLSFSPCYLLPIAILIGTSPAALDIKSQTVSIAASVTGMAVTVVAMLMLFRRNGA